MAWKLLFTLMDFSLFALLRSGADRRRVRVALGVFAVQFALNIAWTPAFFGLQRPDLGLLVIGLLWVALLGTVAAFDRVSRLAAGLLVPYLVWVSFALVLNYAILVGS